MDGILDADTHVAEPPQMWDYLDSEWRPRRPVVVSVPDDTQYGKSDHMWLIDGTIFPKAPGRGGNILVTPTTQSSVRDRGCFLYTSPSPRDATLSRMPPPA